MTESPTSADATASPAPADVTASPAASDGASPTLANMAARPTPAADETASPATPADGTPPKSDPRSGNPARIANIFAFFSLLVALGSLLRADQAERASSANSAEILALQQAQVAAQQAQVVAQQAQAKAQQAQVLAQQALVAAQRAQAEAIRNLSPGSSQVSMGVAALEGSDEGWRYGTAIVELHNQSKDQFVGTINARIVEPQDGWYLRHDDPRDVTTIPVTLEAGHTDYKTVELYLDFKKPIFIDKRYRVDINLADSGGTTIAAYTVDCSADLDKCRPGSVDSDELLDRWTNHSLGRPEPVEPQAEPVEG